MFIEWCFKSHFVLPCTNRHRNKPNFICLCLWGGAFSHNLYFRVQTGTKTNLFLNSLCLLGGAFSRNLYFRVQTGTKTNLFLYSLCLLGGAFSRNLYFRAKTGTKPNLFLVVYVYVVVLLVATCTSVYKQAPQQTYLTGDLVVYVYWVVLSVATCTSGYKQTPKQTHLYFFYVFEWCLKSNIVLPGTNRHHNKPI